MEIRKSHLDDVQRIMTLIHQAQNYFKQQNIDQWQDGYPNEETIEKDMLLKIMILLEQCILLLKTSQLIKRFRDNG